MSKQYAVATIQFQANARQANSAIDSLRQESAKASEAVTRLKKEMKEGLTVGKYNGEELPIAKAIRKAESDVRSYSSAIKDLTKGVQAFESVVKNMRAGTLEDSSAAELKAAQKAAELRISRLRKTDKDYDSKRADLDKVIEVTDARLKELTANVDAFFKKFRDGAVTSTGELEKQKKAMTDLLSTMDVGTKEYQRMEQQIATVDARLRELNGDYKFIRDNISNTKKVSDDMLSSMLKSLQQVNAEGKVTQKTMRENSAMIREIREEQARRVQGVLGGNLEKQSEATIRSALATAKELISTYKTGSKMAKELSVLIVNAEDHLKQYGVEAERAARKEADAVAEAARRREEANRLMEEQLKRGTGLSQSALKAQEQYWQRLIDDPKTAADSLSYYKSKLQEVEYIQNQLVKERGEWTLDRFRQEGKGYAETLSANRLKEYTDNLKAYRDTLPKKENADLIAEIDGYLQKAGASAQKAAEQTMSLADAEDLAWEIGSRGFGASTEKLKLAKKALEEAQQESIRGSKRFTELQNAINKVNLELSKTGEVSKKVDAVLSNPKGKSFNELKQAVEQGRQALASMRTETKEDKAAFDELAAKVKAADFEMKALGNSSKGTATTFDKAWSRLKTYIGLYMGAAVAIQKLVGAMGDLMELSDKMGEVRKTTGFTADEVGRLSDSLVKLDTRTPIQELLGLSAAAGQLGLKSQDDIRGFTEAANELIVALPEMGRESATSLMKIANATGDLRRNSGDVQNTLERVGSTIIALRANSASAAPAITDFVSRVGAVGAQSGITIDQMAALGSTIDALGGRVEMSATALSRMIPAIRNNAFGVANAIGVTEKTLVDLFNQGKSMEAMVLIFQKMRDSVKQFDTSTEEGMNAMADNVEALLGKNASMAEVMKELNQQGARAGIVFGLMSQNVDELSRQLGIAAGAYRDNTALMNEYNNMNETTAAKWEKLKNQFEEMFVSDTAQRWLGNIIDGMRKIVDFVSGNLNPAMNSISIILKSILVAVAGVKTGFGGAMMAMINWVRNLRENIIKLTASLKAFYVANKANVWFALVTAVGYAAYAFYNFKQSVNDATSALAEAENAFETTRREIGNLFSSLTDATNKQIDFKKSTVSLREAEEKLRKELEALRKKLGEGAEQSGEFKKKQDELEEAHKKVAEAEGKASEATSKRLSLIKEINDRYSSYLGYMLSEASTAETVASAHDLIIASLKEEMYWREQNNAFQTITQQHGEALKKYQGKALAELNELNPVMQQNIMAGWQRTLSGVKYDASAGGFVLENGMAYKDLSDAVDALYSVFKENIARNVGQNWATLEAGNYWGDWIDDGFRDWTKESLKIIQETATLQSLSGSAAQKAHESTIEQVKANTDALIAQAQERGGVSNKKLAEAIVGIQKNLSKYGEVAGSYSQFAKDISLRGIANVLLKDLPIDTRNAVIAEMERVAANGVPGKTNVTQNTSPYGTFDRVTSPYSEWDADSLVARRKEMLERVRSLANGADVQAVLSQDAKFISEATRNNIKDTRQAIEWYNAERLKIQDALHERYLTNTGDWMEPSKEKKGKRSEKQAKEEMKAYLDMLDAYYTDQQTMIQKAQTEGEITEAEGQRRLLANETTWRERRIELQKLYANKFAEVTRKEQEAIFDIIAEQSDDTVDMVENTIAGTVKFIQKIGDKDEAVYRRIMGSLTKDMAVDLNKQQKALSKYQKSVDAILRKGFDSADKAYAQFKETLDTLGVVLSGEEGGVEVFLQRVSKLSEYVREAYKYISGDEMAEQLMSNSQQAIAELESLQEAAFNRENYAESEALGERMRIEQDFYSWLASTDRQTRDILLAQLQDYSEQYEEAIQKLAQQQAKLDNKRFAKSSEGRAADAVIKTSKDNTDVAQFRSGLMDTGAFGKLDEDRSQLKTLDLEINKQKQLIAYTRELMDARDLELRQQMAKWEAEAAEHQRRMEEIGEEGEGYAELAAAKKTADEQVEALRQSIATQEAVRRQTEMDQQEALDDLMIQHVQKMRDINATMMGTVADYISSFEEFGQSFGEAVYGDKEDRQNAAKELLKEVATTSKKLIQQWLTNMVMKQFINQQEVASDQATAVASESIKAQQTISELGMEASKTTGQVAAGEAGAMAHEVGSKGWLGIAIGAAIGVMLSTLLGVVLGKINKAKSEVASIGGVSAGRLSTGMLTYGGGNVQEVVGDDGVVYRAKDVGRTRRTHVTHHTELTEVGGKPAIVGEKGSELVVPAATTKRLQMNYPYILKAISMVEQHGSLGGYGYGGGMRRGARRYAGGNVEEMVDGAYGTNGTNEAAITAEQAAAMTTALDNAAAAYDRLTEQLKKPVYINMHGPEGLRAKNAEAERFEKKYGKDY